MIKISPEKLKDILLKAGIIDGESFDLIREEAERKRQDIAEILISQGLINEDYLFLLLTKAFNVERVDLGKVNIDETVLRLLPEEIARQKKAIPFGKDNEGNIAVAMEDPTDLEAIDFLSRRLGSRIRPYLTSDDGLNRGFSLYEAKATKDFKKVIEDNIKESLKKKIGGDLEEIAAELPIVAIVDNLFSYAVSLRASDIHFEILDDVVLVRFRIDGVLHEIIRMPKEIHSAIVARIKILARLRVDEHAKPQDGRFRHRTGGGEVDARVSIMPTFYGEKLVLRILIGANKPLSFEEIGFFEENVTILKEAIKKAYGMILACGPTGSGKTTTLYSIMNILNRPEVNVMTIEDPIEYDMRNVNQVQVNSAAGIDFAKGLRSIVRQDPNIIMVGEIRDTETANISVQAALTGHLVLSSLHTNDAPTTIPRLIDMGVPPFLVAAVLNNAIAQRLVRKVHVNCIESYTPQPEIFGLITEQLKVLGVNSSRVKMPRTFYRGKGCEGCNFTGFRGRVGIFENLHINEVIRKFIVSKDFSLKEFQKLAINNGMITMFEDGLKKIHLGITTIEEVFRVIRE